MPPVSASIVLVEDNPADAGLVRKALESHGVEGEIIVFSDGEKAIEFIESVDANEVRSPDLALIDLNLPKRSGRDVLASLRRSSCNKVPIIVLSSSDAKEDKADAVRLGASRYIRKPTRLDEFLSLGAVFRELLESLH